MLRYAERNVMLKVNPKPDVEPMTASVLYTITFRRGKVPGEFSDATEGTNRAIRLEMASPSLRACKFAVSRSMDNWATTNEAEIQPK